MRKLIIGGILCFGLGFLSGLYFIGLRNSSQESVSVVTVEKHKSQFKRKSRLQVKSQGRVVKAQQQFNSEYHGDITVEMMIPKKMFHKKHRIDIGLGVLSDSFLCSMSYAYKIVSFTAFVTVPFEYKGVVSGGAMISLTVISW